MKLFVDDKRDPPTEAWLIARDYMTAIMALETGLITIISLDHDLGDAKTGYDVICWIEKQVRTNDFIPPKIMTCHSANPVGKTRIEQAIKAINKEKQNGSL